jgi:hypothetical protein
MSECDPNSPEFQAQQAKERAEEAAKEKRLFNKLDEIKAVSEAHAVLSEQYYEDMLERFDAFHGDFKEQNEKTNDYQSTMTDGLEQFMGISNNNNGLLTSINNNIISINSSLKNYFSKMNRESEMMSTVNRDMNRRKEEVLKDLHTNRETLLLEIWDSQMDKLNAIHDTMVQNAEANSKLMSGLMGNIVKSLPEKSEISQQRREQQQRDLMLQSEREKDRSIFLGMHGLLEKLVNQTKMDTGTGGGGGSGGGFFASILAALKTGAGKFWTWIKKGFAGVLGFFGKMGRNVLAFFRTAGSKVLGFLGTIGKNIMGVLGRAGKFLMSGMGRIFGALGTMLTGVFAKIAPLVAGLGAKAMGALGAIGAKSVAMMGPAAAVAAAGAAGWAIGSWLDDKFGISDAISDWLSGPSPEEIVQENLEKESLARQRTQNLAKTEAKAKLQESTGLDMKTIERMMAGQETELTANLSQSDRDLLVEAKVARIRETKELAQRTQKEFLFHREEGNKEEAERLEKLHDRQVAGLRKQREQIMTIREIDSKQKEQAMAKVAVEVKDREQRMLSKQKDITETKVMIEQQQRQEQMDMMQQTSLADKRKEQEKEAREKALLNGINTVANNTKDIADKKNVNLVNSGRERGITASVGNMPQHSGY